MFLQSCAFFHCDRFSDVTIDDNQNTMSVSTGSAAPAPWMLAPTWQWDGDDGKWSTFAIKVGTPPQSFRILPSTTGAETWIPYPPGCEGSLAGISDCGSLRGVDIFDGQPSLGYQTNASSTWDLIGIYELAAEQNLWGTTGNPGYYGYDTVSLEQYDSQKTATLEGQTVAGVATWNAWLGVLGLGTAEAYFDVEKKTNPALIENLANKNVTPGMSFGYAAGASYANGGVPGSLVFGGYDKARFKESGLSFPVNGEKNKTLPLSVESIVVDNVPSGTMSLLSNGDAIVTTIDSTTAQMWLPQNVCDLFAEAFGLRYDSYTGLYLVNNTMHSQLKQSNPSVTFTIGSTDSSSETTNIVLPYAAFDLQAGIPLFNFTTNYFPLRVAANASQQVLGRAFLQEAYIFVDWERNNFTIGQAIHQNSTTNIVTVLSPEYNTSSSDSGLSTGAIAGIAVGGVAAIALIGGIIAFFFIRKRRANRQPNEKLLGELSDTSMPPPEIMSENVYELQEGENSKHELDVSQRIYAKHAPQELQGESFERELEGDGERLGKPQRQSNLYELP